MTHARLGRLRQGRCCVPHRSLGRVDHRTVARDPRLHVIGALGYEVDRDPHLARVQVGLVRDGSDALFLAVLQLLEPSNDLPHVGA